MCGLPVTSGLWENTGCALASSTTTGSLLPFSAWAQKATARSVSWNGMPTAALNHWRSLSTKLTTAIGVRQMRDARTASLLKASSEGVSRMA